MPSISQIGLQLGEDAKHVEKRLQGRWRGIDGLLRRLEMRTLGAKFVDEVL
jgi:hypothetical protein